MNISYKPTAGLSYDPEEPKYWDEGALAGEIQRVFEICHGCRMCFKYCDSFPILFDLLDRKHEGDVRKIDAERRTGSWEPASSASSAKCSVPTPPATDTSSSSTSHAWSIVTRR
jgi:hypothetical protein